MFLFKSLFFNHKVEPSFPKKNFLRLLSIPMTSKPLSEKNISVFVFSTFDTDYVMFKTENKFKVISILENLEYKFLI
mgnify:CR=1 FL=1